MLHYVLLQFRNLLLSHLAFLLVLQKCLIHISGDNGNGNNGNCNCNCIVSLILQYKINL